MIQPNGKENAVRRVAVGDTPPRPPTHTHYFEREEWMGHKEALPRRLLAACTQSSQLQHVDGRKCLNNRSFASRGGFLGVENRCCGFASGLIVSYTS